MNKQFFYLCLLIFIPFSFLHPQDKVKLITEGGFSYSVPADWEPGSITGMPYKIVRDKLNKGFRANINVHREKNNFTFDEYYKSNIKELKEYMNGFREIEQSGYSSTAGLKGKRFICSTNQGGKTLVQAFYFFESADKTKTIITGTALLEDKDSYLPIFDTITKSFKTDK